MSDMDTAPFRDKMLQARLKFCGQTYKHTDRQTNRRTTLKQNGHWSFDLGAIENKTF